MNRNENDPVLQRKAQRALWVLYAVMIVFIVAPLVLWWLLRE